MIIKSDFCYICGLGFDETRKKTLHHAIPKKLKPIHNVKIPICLECHRKQNEEDAIYKRYFHVLKVTMIRMNEKLKENENN